MSDEVQGAPPLPTFAPDERVCGNCKLWRANQLDEKRGWVGNCRVQPNRGLFPPSAPLCDAFAPRGEQVTVRHPTASPQGALRVEAVPSPKRARPLQPIGPTVVRAGQERPVTAPRAVSAQNLNEELDLEGEKMTRAELMELFLEASGLTEVTLAGKWEGGTVRLIPADQKLQAKDLPIDALFHKVVMVRDRLRVLEQKINAHTKLTDVEKAEMQQYVTRCYGSLTTFNVLFKEKGDQFVGSKDD